MRSPAMAWRWSAPIPATQPPPTSISKLSSAAHPEYVAGYFQYGQFLAKSGRTEEARSTLTAGIATAQRTGDEHARSEMEAALAELG